MTRRRLVLASASAIWLVTLSGCGVNSDGSGRGASDSALPSSPAQSSELPGGESSVTTSAEGQPPNGRVPIAAGVTLVPGRDGRLPVSVRWVRELGAPEELAVDGDVVYVADEVAWALRLADGMVVWETADPSQNGLAADGGVVIGLSGPDRVRMWAPYNYDLTVDRSSGKLVSLHWAHVGGKRPRGMQPFPAPRPKYRLGPFPERIVARDRNGDVAWKILVQSPWYSTLRPVAVPGGMALVTSSGHLVVLDYL